MKNFKYFFALLLMFSIHAHSEFSAIFVKVKKGTGNLRWVDGETFCKRGGTNCKKRTHATDGNPVSNIAITPISTGGYMVTGTVTDSSYFDVTDPVAGTFTYSVPATNMTFGPTDYLRIEVCTAYPALENVEIDLEGVQTNSMGVFTVYIP